MSFATPDDDDPVGRFDLAAMLAITRANGVVLPYWAWKKLKDAGYDVADIEYNAMEYREPHPDRPVRYLNRAARRAAQHGH